jgi:glutamate-ammonia-ligase adenylyltransferase
MGTKGELVPDLEFYRRYFSKEARTWERLAWVRARHIAGDKELSDSLEKSVEDFLFSLPWGEKERGEVLQMRRMLEQNAKRGRGIYDLKLGAGGLMDGEFLIQYLLIKEKIREPSIIEGFKILMEKYLLRDAYKSYMFLRTVETILRLSKERGGSVLHDRDIPRIARFLNMDREDFTQELRRNQHILREAFLEFLG